jgi:cyanophycinase-like exopeptidase
MNRSLSIGLLLVLSGTACAQTYTSWFTGNPEDSPAVPLGGVCLMGGASEFDPAMQWFLDRANGGDVLVLRASGSNGYNDYMYADLGGVNSVETILFNNASAAYDPYVAGRIEKAEAIWFAGGDQWNYVDFWRGTPVMELVNDAVAERNAAIGGTSAGMAILGACYFSAQFGSVTSAEALANPMGPLMAVDCTPFLNVPFLAGTITDTHYDNPDRRGRHFAFLARLAAAGDSTAYGIACNEYVAVCIDPDGMAHVYGEYPEYQEFAYFLQMNCIPPTGPETCQAGFPLTWDRNAMAVKTYKVPGLPNGSNWFNLNDHLSGSGGSWEDWSAVNGVFNTQPGLPPDCLPTAVDAANPEPLYLLWEPLAGLAQVVGTGPGSELQLFRTDGRRVAAAPCMGTRCALACPDDANGVFILRAAGPGGSRSWKLVRP